MSIVSIIIPIYNPGVALKKCLDSAINQSYQDIELILVNDGSTDSSDKICKEYAANDSRILYLEQQNFGVSTARNNGVTKAGGRYITFIDSDDSVEENYIESMVTAIEKSDADIVIQGLKSVSGGQLSGSESFQDGVYKVNTLSEDLFDKIFYFCGPYCKLFKSEIIKGHDIIFPADLAYGEDAVFYYEYLSKCRIIESISNTSYIYSVGNQNALSTKTLSPDKFWRNQHNRRSAYIHLKKSFALPPTITSTERFCKMAGVNGMLTSIFKSDANDKTIASYFEVIKNDTDFGFSEIKPRTFKQRLIFSLLKNNSRMSRTVLKMMYS